jgi:hypothetical protein
MENPCYNAAAWLRVMMGLPCMHELAHLVSGECISFDLVVKHWHLYYSASLLRPAKIFHTLEAFNMEIYKLKYTYLQWMPAKHATVHARLIELASGILPMLANPMHVKTKRRALGAKAKKGSASSTKCEPFAFENPVKGSQKCTNCGGINHNKCSCPQHSNQQPRALSILQGTPLLAPPKGVH